MEDIKLRDYLNDIDFAPMFFLKGANNIVSFSEFREFIETVNFERYFRYRGIGESNLRTNLFLDIAYTYCVFFDKLYDKNDLIYQDNKIYIKYWNSKQQKYGMVYKGLEELNLDSKWYNLINDFTSDQDLKLIDKIIMNKLLKQQLVNEFIYIVSTYIPETIKNTVVDDYLETQGFGDYYYNSIEYCYNGEHPIQKYKNNLKKLAEE